jgi:hypothetical protein
MMQRFYAEQTGASWCVRDHEIITPLDSRHSLPPFSPLRNSRKIICPSMV